MKVINIREARAGLPERVDQVQKEPVCLTRYGKPVAILAGAEGADEPAFSDARLQWFHRR